MGGMRGLPGARMGSGGIVIGIGMLGVAAWDGPPLFREDSRAAILCGCAFNGAAAGGVGATGAAFAGGNAPMFLSMVARSCAGAGAAA